MPMDYMMLLLQPSEAQKAEMAQLLLDQQNPASPRYHQWLTPEAFADRFGVSASDFAKISAWLKAEGFTVAHQARGRNWIAFAGTAGQTSRSFHTSIHRYSVNGETHFANSTDPQVPEALAGVVGGFMGFNDFRPHAHVRMAGPAFTSGKQNYLAPTDFSTIYNLTPLQKAGLDGTGSAIVVVGQSGVLATDLSAFQTRFGVPSSTPHMVPYSGVDPGLTGDQIEGELDLEWANAIAPKANLTYVYGTNAFQALIYAIEQDYAPVISVSYGTCEAGISAAAYEAIGQEANAEGITIVASSGDAGPAGCDEQGFQPTATLGMTPDFPAVLPEVTAVGGTQFTEGTGTYWGTNSSLLGSVLSYIPESAWNESGPQGLAASGGGVSILFPKPAWQTGTGVPSDGGRDVPDVALSAAGHDGYLVAYNGALVVVGGTSCGAPSMAGVVALLNQNQVKNGSQTKIGLGNINPQLYRLAQKAPSAFHDVTGGNTLVSCEQGSASCGTGSYGYQAGPGYDQATGLGSFDASTLFTEWNSAAQSATMTLSANPATGTVNDTIQVTATVKAVSGTPTGSVSFSALAGLPLGAAPLTTSGSGATATISIPLSSFKAVGTFLLEASYSGDAVFSGAGATTAVKVSKPTGSAAVVLSAPNAVGPVVDLDSQGQAWTTTLTLHELAGVAAMVTGLTMDGQALSVAQYFPSPDILPGGALTANVVLRSVQAPLTHTFAVSGTDAMGQSWSRQATVAYNPVGQQNNFSFTATPQVVTQTSNPSCQFPVQVNLNDEGGFWNSFASFYAGTNNVTSQFVPTFGTWRLQAWGSLQGTLCLNGITPPGREYVYATPSNGQTQQTVVEFAPAPANPVTIGVAPTSVSMSSGSVSQAAQATLNVSLSDKTQQWTAHIYPNNRTSNWLSLSQLSGTGPAQITLTASGFGFGPGAYRAWIVFESQNAQPQTVTVPVMFVLGANSSMSIAGIAGPPVGQTGFAPGMIVSVYGTNLSSSTAVSTPTGSYLPYASGSVTAAVDGFAAPILYVSPTQINLQIPYEAGSGPAVLGITNNGQTAGYLFQIAPTAPAIYTDGNGNLAGNPAVGPGAIATLYLNGVGEMGTLIKTGVLAPNTPEISPATPLSVTVGGVPALVQWNGLCPGTIGTTQINFYIPAGVKPGPQPVVVTVNRVASPPVNITVSDISSTLGG